ncbi:MAG: thioesterase family protein [Burkholderiales bacterium]|nr:thioesterase family protein [Burkholderiales bacterium]
MSAHAFDEAIALAQQPDGSFLGRTSAAYANFIGPYGGITAAQMIQAVLQHPARQGEPVAFTVNFAAAVAEGEFTIEAVPARTNRSTQHWMVRMLQQGEVVTTATLMTASRRETWGLVEAAMPQVPEPSDVPRQPLPHRPVAWLERYERRFIEGDLPREWKGQDSGHSRTRLWLRDAPERPVDFVSLTAMADNFFPRLWLRRATQVALGTVTMTVYFHADTAVLQSTGSGFLLAQAQGQGFRHGYLDQEGLLWNQSGELLASTTQLMYFKE